MGSGGAWCLAEVRGLAQCWHPRVTAPTQGQKSSQTPLTPPRPTLVPFPGYVDIGIIPVGAREIRIEEVAEAGNFLALRSEDPEKYFLNGGWTIQWNGDYRVAGTTFTYKRTGNWENLTSPGPTVEPVWIQVRWLLPSRGAELPWHPQPGMGSGPPWGVFLWELPSCWPRE